MKPLSILVVDDDRIILDSLSEFLRLEGYTVGGTRDFKGALQALERDPYHLVVTDVNMPDADGFELLRVIKQRYPDIVVIIITGYGTIESAVEAIKMGAYDYLTKPIIDDEIRLVVERALQQQSLIRENQDLRNQLEDGCRKLQVPCIAVLDPVVAELGAHLDAKILAQPGRQHVMDAEYFSRIEAMHFVLSHDDGQSTRDLEQADVVLLGVSRTSKTPTSIYLANRGIKTANIPIVPGSELPEELFAASSPLIIGLTKDPKRLVEIRQQRLRILEQDEETDYVDLDKVSKEINDARRLFTKHDWPVINVSRKSIEETAATIIQLYNRRREQDS